MANCVFIPPSVATGMMAVGANATLFSPVAAVSHAAVSPAAASPVAISPVALSMQATVLESAPKVHIVDSVKELKTDMVFGRVDDGSVILQRKNGGLSPLRNRFFDELAKMTDETGRIFTVDPVRFGCDDIFVAVSPQYVENLGRRYDSSGNPDNIRLFQMKEGSIVVKWLSPEQVKKAAMKYLGTGLRPFDAEYYKSASHSVGYKSVAMDLPEGRSTRLYKQRITVSAGKFEREISIVIETNSIREFKEKRDELISLLLNIPSALLSRVKRIEAYRRVSTLYGLDVSEKPIAGHYQYDGDVLRMFNFDEMIEDDKIKTMRHELWHSLAFEADKAPILFAIKAGGAGLQRLIAKYTLASPGEHPTDSWVEYAATAGATLLYFGTDSERLLGVAGFMMAYLGYMAQRSFDAVVSKRKKGQIDVIESSSAIAGKKEEIGFALVDFDNARTYANFGLREEALEGFRDLLAFYESLGEKEYVKGLERDLKRISTAKNSPPKPKDSKIKSETNEEYLRVAKIYDDAGGLLTKGKEEAEKGDVWPFIAAGYYYRAGFLYEKAGKFILAAEEFRKAKLVMFSLDLYAHINAGFHQAIQLRKGGRAEEAAKIFQSLAGSYDNPMLADNPQVIARIGYMLFELGVAREESGKPRTAKSAFNLAKDYFIRAAASFESQDNAGLARHMNEWKERAGALVNGRNGGGQLPPDFDGSAGMSGEESDSELAGEGMGMDGMGAGMDTGGAMYVDPAMTGMPFMLTVRPVMR